MTYTELSKYVALIGSDEAGKGEWLGPMTIAAVALTPQQSLYLVTQGVMDSKKLRLETILQLAGIIKGSNNYSRRGAHRCGANPQFHSG